jgi:hypothetical protein
MAKAGCAFSLARVQMIPMNCGHGYWDGISSTPFWQ